MEKKILTTLCILILAGACIGYFLYKDKAKDAVSTNTETSFDDSVGKIKPLDPKKVTTNPETGEMFVNDQILITFKDGTKIEEVEKIVEEIDGEIVGFITVTDDYQVELKEKASQEQLNKIVDKLKKDKQVLTASVNHVYENTELAADFEIPPNDDWGGKEQNWETIPGGNNWYLDTIRAQAAWKLVYGENGENTHKTKSVKIGVYDNKFLSELAHDDLVWYDILETNPPAIYQKESTGEEAGDSHGTAVAALIGAKPNNKFGTAGVVWNHELYGFGYKMHSEETEKKMTEDKNYRRHIDELTHKYGIVSLLSKGVKVINYSASFYYSTKINEWTEDGNQEKLDETRKEMSDYWTPFMKKLLKHYDFLLVTGAGNNPHDAALTSGFNAIKDKEVQKHILVAGAVKYHPAINGEEWYKTVDSDYFQGVLFPHTFSYGRRVDILAPGWDVLTATTNNDIYKKGIGTSYAAPLVTGVAGLIWNANPDLTAKQVKEILVASGDREYIVEYGNIENHKFAILNAQKAVRVALHTISDPSKEKEKTNSIIGETVSHDEEHTPVKDVSVSVRTLDNEPVSGMIDSSDADGMFEVISLKHGKYKIVFSKTGYKTKEIKVEVNHELIAPITIEMEPANITETSAKDILRLYELFNKELIKIGEEKNWDYVNYDWDQITPDVRTERRGLIKERLLPYVTSNFAEKNILPNLNYIYSGDALEAPYFPSDFDDEIRLSVNQTSVTETEIKTITFARAYSPGFHYTIKATWDKKDEKWKLDDQNRVNANEKSLEITQEEAVKYLTIDDITAKFISEKTVEGVKMYTIEQKYPNETQTVMINANTGETVQADSAEAVDPGDNFEPISATEKDFAFTYETVGSDTGEIKGNVPNGGTITIKNGGRILLNRTGENRNYWYMMPLSGDSVMWESVDHNQGILVSIKPGKTTLTFDTLGDGEFIYTLNIIVE